jgi:outer membrane protein, multidrug efflux system
VRTAALISVTALAVACSPHKVTRDPAPPVAVPDGHRTTLEDAGAELPETWWMAFDDPQLSELVERSLGGNLQLGAAWARLTQARAAARQAGALRLPQVDANAEAGRRRMRFDFGEGGVLTPQVDRFALSLAAGYEVDLWGKMAAGSRAAALDAAAVHDDAQAMAISVVAEVSEAWFDVVSQRAQRKLVEEQLRISETFLELTKMRFQQGLASALEVYQQQQQAVSTRSRLALIDAAIELQHNRLSLLLGRPPGDVPGIDRDTFPDLPPLPGTGVPADLLDRRPDVRAARRRVESADHRVAVAVADRLPSLRLSGSLSTEAGKITDLFTTPLWSILAGVTGPIFDGGRRRAEVDRTRAVVEERLLTYGHVLLAAMVEVDNALVSERQQRIHIRDLEEQVEIAANTLREAQERYRQGLIDYLPVLTALQTQQQVQLSLLQAHRQLISYRIQLCRALGGTWTQNLAAPARGPEAGGRS